MKLDDPASARYVSPYTRFMIYLGLGELAAARTWLRWALNGAIGLADSSALGC
jgi:hypothetical protein